MTNQDWAASELLRSLGHDALNVQEASNANLGIPDEAVLQFAIDDGRAVLTLNRNDFARYIARRLSPAALLCAPMTLTEYRWRSRFIKRSPQKRLSMVG